MFQSQSYRRPKLPRFDFRFGFRLLRLHPPREGYRSKAGTAPPPAQAYGVVTGEQGAGLRASYRVHSSAQVVAHKRTGHGKMGANMRLLSGFGCFLCGSLAVLLCAVPANPDRHVKATLAPLDAIAALAHSDAGLTTSELRTALADSDGATLADPVIKVPLVEAEVNVSPREASGECVLTEECIDQYLWSVYERTRKVDTIKVKERIKATV